MGVGEDFKTFCGNLFIPNRSSKSTRFELITRRFNMEFWDTDSRTSHSIYAGSFGRNTATGKTSDVDVIFWLTVSYYKTYNGSPRISEITSILDIKKTYYGN